MKIVIDIDNESYDHIKAYKNDDVLPMGWYAISHGTPLTKVDCISRAKACDYIAEFVNDEYSTQSECEMVNAMVEGIQHLPSVKQVPCEDALSPTVEPVGLEEAKKLIYQEWKSKVAEDNPNQRLLVAYQIAMKALEQEPCEDAISRQATIDAIKNMCGVVSPLSDHVILISKVGAITELNMLPPAQVESDVPDINDGNINFILNKIRHEIESCLEVEEPHLCDYRYYINVGLDMALDIIDKYNLESEE